MEKQEEKVVYLLKETLMDEHCRLTELGLSVYDSWAAADKAMRKAFGNSVAVEPKIRTSRCGYGVAEVEVYAKQMNGELDEENTWTVRYEVIKKPIITE